MLVTKENIEYTCWGSTLLKCWGSKLYSIHGHFQTYCQPSVPTQVTVLLTCVTGLSGMESDQIRSVTQSCLTLCDPMNHSTPGLPVQHQLLEFTQTHVHRVGDAIQPSHPLSSPSPPAPNPSQHQGLFQWVKSFFFFSVKELCLIYVNTSLTGDWQTKLCPIEQFE